MTLASPDSKFVERIAKDAMNPVSPKLHLTSTWSKVKVESNSEEKVLFS